MPAFLTLAHGDARVQLAPHTGGAIVGFQWRDVHVLRSTAPDRAEAGDVRRHACYPLVPYSNRIAHGRLTFRGVTHQLDLNFGDHPHSIHGVGWQRPWNVRAHDATSALLACEHRADGRPEEPDTRAWPWPFRATQRFQLFGEESPTLRMQLTLENTGTESFPFGLGWHPFFPTNRDTVLAFRAEGVWETDETVLPVRHVAAGGTYSFDPPHAIGTTSLDNVYTGWTGEAEVRYARERRMTLMRGDTSCPYFVCYIPAHAQFIAIEPVTQMTDAFNRAERGETDTGTRVLAPGEAFSCTMEISARETP